MRRGSLVVAMGMVLILGVGCSKPPRGKDPNTPTRTAWMAPPVMTPEVAKAAQSGLADDAPVVGVVVDGKARAYSLKALSHSQRHVVNDQIGSIPVSVVYCDQQDCLRTYTAEHRDRPIELRQMGYSSSEGLLISLGTMIFSQTTGTAMAPMKTSLPLQSLDSKRTTWKEWRDQHPSTEVYVGDPPARDTVPQNG